MFSLQNGVSGNLFLSSVSTAKSLSFCGDESSSSFSWMFNRQSPYCASETPRHNTSKFYLAYFTSVLSQIPTKCVRFNGFAHERLSYRFMRRIIWNSSSLWWYFLLWANFDRLFESKSCPKVSSNLMKSFFQVYCHKVVWKTVPSAQVRCQRYFYPFLFSCVVFFVLSIKLSFHKWVFKFLIVEKREGCLLCSG